MFDRCVFSSIVMTICVGLLGCLAASPTMKFEPIEPVEAASVKEPFKVVEPETKIEPTIIMHSASFNCPPCEAWIRNDMPNWKRAGWTIPEPFKEAVSGQTYPWFEITDGDGLRFTVVGPLTKAAYERERKKALGK